MINASAWGVLARRSVHAARPHRPAVPAHLGLAAGCPAVGLHPAFSGAPLTCGPQQFDPGIQAAFAHRYS